MRNGCVAAGLRCFVAVAEHLGFSRAAEALFVSQPGLSKQIRTLESALRVDLFIRNRRGVRLTAAGAALLPGASRTLQAWDDAQNDLKRAQSALQTTLVVGLHLGVERGLLPAVRTHLAASTLTIDFTLRQASWFDPTGGLAVEGVGGVDVAFVWLPLPQPGLFQWVVIAEEPRRLLVSTAHPLAGRSSVSFTELLDEPFLALPASAGPLRDHLLALSERGPRPVHISGEVASTEEAVEAVAANQGICLIAAGNVHTFQRDGIAILDVTDVSPNSLPLAWRHDDHRPALLSFVDAVRSAAANLSSDRDC